jgi:hypothetical protein
MIHRGRKKMDSVVHEQYLLDWQAVFTHEPCLRSVLVRNTGDQALLAVPSFSFGRFRLLLT